MGLLEFLRQWQRGRLTAGVIVSVLLHAALLALLVGGGLPVGKYDVKRGEPLMVELPKEDDSPPPGAPGAPEPRPAAPPVAAPPAPPAPKVAATPPSPAPKPAARPAPRPEPAERAPRSEPERRVASGPPPPAPEHDPAPAPPAAAAATPAPPAPARAPDATPQIERAPQERPAGERLAALPPSSPGPPDVLSALRRGQGGAGGSGRGRGGIDGTPIPLESEDPRYNDYLEQLRRMLQAKMTWPCDNFSRKRGDCRDRDEDLMIEFGIYRNGQLAFVEVIRSSSQPVYDENSANTVKLASPFPPPPPAMLAAMRPGSTGVPILVHFRYNYTVDYRIRLMP
jgi:TonB family protein